MLGTSVEKSHILISIVFVEDAALNIYIDHVADKIYDGGAKEKNTNYNGNYWNTSSATPPEDMEFVTDA